MSITEGLVLARGRLGLTQAEAAGLLGTRQANVSADERGRLRVGESIRDRIESFSMLDAASAYADGWPVTVASTAAALRAIVAAKSDVTDVLRPVIQAADDFARLISDEDRRFFLARPGATGSVRWDALLAALAVELCRRYGLQATPAWTRQPDRYLEETWWVGAAGDVESLRALALKGQPAGIPCPRRDDGPSDAGVNVNGLLDGERIVALLRELAGRLDARGLEADLFVVAGTAMALAYDRLRVTRDIDAVGEPMEAIDAEAREMAIRHRDLPPDWLSARVLPLLPRSFDADRVEALSWPGLSVNVASPRRLLAMKVQAGRYDRDLQDIWILCQVLGLDRLDQVWAMVDEVWGTGMIREDVALLVGDYLRARGLRDGP